VCVGDIAAIFPECADSSRLGRVGSAIPAGGAIYPVRPNEARCEVGFGCASETEAVWDPHIDHLWLGLAWRGRDANLTGGAMYP
jgi:hypothetical protein